MMRRNVIYATPTFIPRENGQLAGWLEYHHNVICEMCNVPITAYDAGVNIVWAKQVSAVGHVVCERCIERLNFDCDIVLQ